ncbi:uncharacterized protein OCT59_009429 [Rhizophagus irregularis]|uniref:Uncharacterized protein n=1 Tax=Rhizophagus irregularis (strain DAOM 181602 / DAOM 197198 / MUCL 43194) TaxID=747089 RepID=A0A2P4QWF2_RHIID|nr:hypothetical protein GLOIN_2v1501867 [Rhizophagus irregularis DAOM 181602=DAOM 197198]POG82001.1 hypothetical protein GLOIN_2v1501867 [Rhizophagus irregularis DAOM 181602=DAOM 197198]UZO18108.1 hypothetical protein OCT59_009429 [Rhizophagus irregularis]GBC24910.2 hypothetical protein GLOIN_2v1501867 [Rhizophagus irregularis DAOM 181602=DAOM 197198]|eukprot:XP_025188867.1 hypothetical protein GLOIN_2v1501867 [Rhizophagus irregularis DAOM 181602=DAOM 197198]
MVIRREDDTLQGILRIFYKKLQISEKILLYAYLIDMTGYTFLFTIYLLVSGRFITNAASLALLLFPIISGITMFYSKTILHGISFLVVHSFPLIVGVFLFYTQRNTCSDLPSEFCFFPTNVTFYTSGVLLLIFLIISTIFYCTILYHIWSKKIWPIRHKYPYINDKDIISMDAIYQIQFPIFHAKIMIIGLYTVFYIYTVWIVSILEKNLRGMRIINFFVPFNIVIIYYAYFMLKGVRDEKKWMMYIVYFGNIFQAIFLYYATKDVCYSTHKPFSFLYCFKYGAFFDVFYSLTVISWIILILSTWNSIRCQRNFGLHLGQFLKYEPIPDAFKSGTKLESIEQIL